VGFKASHDEHLGKVVVAECVARALEQIRRVLALGAAAVQVRHENGQIHLWVHRAVRPHHGACRHAEHIATVVRNIVDLHHEDSTGLACQQSMSSRDLPVVGESPATSVKSRHWWTQPHSLYSNRQTIGAT